VLTRTRIYWITQTIGWIVIIVLNIFNASFNNKLTPDVYLSGFFLCVCGIVVTHVYREIVQQLKWNELGILAIIPRIFLGTLGMSLVYTLLYGSLNDLFIPNAKQVLVFSDLSFFTYVLNFCLLFLVWSMLYFAIHIFENYKRQEINNLKLKASMTEIELSSIKAQMNPHFMFNAMNSIRALVDENPAKAKEAITGLSSILRTILMSAKRQLVPFSEELSLVEKYLSLEKIRFEERLLVTIEASSETLDFPFPPLMLQTIVENGIKHGISHLVHGGLIVIKANVVAEQLLVEVTNTGELKAKGESTGIGIANTEKRLKSLYGPEAKFALQSSGDYVKASILIPYRKQYESIDH